MSQVKKLTTVHRLIGILGRIHKGGCGRNDLKECFGVSERTISRDINALSVEFPIYYDKERGTYRFVEGYSLLGRKGMVN